MQSLLYIQVDMQKENVKNLNGKIEGRKQWCNSTKDHSFRTSSLLLKE
ncbi:hypothetical protein [Tepidibacillus marianensis]